jgi:uncharacterized protein YgiM (DUF1202 family)
MKRAIRVLLGILLLWAGASAILYALFSSGILLGGDKSPTPLYVVVTNTPTPLYLVVTNTPTPPSYLVVTTAPTTAPTGAPTPAPLPSATPTAAPPRAVVTSDTLNARSGPGTGYPILVTLSRGDELAVTGRTAANNWLQVQLAGGKQGWVWAEYVDLNTSADAIALVQNIPPPPTPAATRTPVPPTPTLTVDEQIARIAKGQHGTLPQPGQSGGVAAGGDAEVTIINDTPYVLTLLVGSPNSVSITIEACSGCKVYGANGPSSCPESGRPRKTIRLKPGNSQVVARVSDASVTPFLGTWQLSPDTGYFNCFFIVTR